MERIYDSNTENKDNYSWQLLSYLDLKRTTKAIPMQGKPKVKDEDLNRNVPQNTGY